MSLLFSNRFLILNNCHRESGHTNHVFLHTIRKTVPCKMKKLQKKKKKERNMCHILNSIEHARQEKLIDDQKQQKKPPLHTKLC